MKQTQSENGSVTATSPHDIAVKSQPHRPMPFSDSSAEKQKMRTIKKILLRLSGKLKKNAISNDALHNMDFFLLKNVYYDSVWPRFFMVSCPLIVG